MKLGVNCGVFAQDGVAGVYVGNTGIGIGFGGDGGGFGGLGIAPPDGDFHVAAGGPGPVGMDVVGQYMSEHVPPPPPPSQPLNWMSASPSSSDSSGSSGSKPSKPSIEELGDRCKLEDELFLMEIGGRCKREYEREYEHLLKGARAPVTIADLQ